MLAVAWGAIDQVLAGVGSLAGSVVVDATNPYGPGPQPAPGQTVAAFNAARLPGARYVRGFNTLTAGFQAHAANRSGDQRAVLFICGDYPAAKDIVAELIEGAGFAAVDVGSTAHAVVMEAPRRPGSFYGEEYRLPQAQAVAHALRHGHPIPPLSTRPRPTMTLQDALPSPRQAPSHRPWWYTRSRPTRPIDRGQHTAVTGTAEAAATQAIVVIRKIQRTGRGHGGRLCEEVAS
jgi:hypothetical protein